MKTFNNSIRSGLVVAAALVALAPSAWADVSDLVVRGSLESRLEQAQAVSHGYGMKTGYKLGNANQAQDSATKLGNAEFLPYGRQAPQSAVTMQAITVVLAADGKPTSLPLAQAVQRSSEVSATRNSVATPESQVVTLAW